MSSVKGELIFCLIVFVGLLLIILISKGGKKTTNATAKVAKVLQMFSQRNILTNKIAPGCLAYIIAPAFKLAVGRVVQVVRLATGDSEIDGVEFDCEGGFGVVWVVRGQQIPWGDTLVNVLAIDELCLRKLIDLPGSQCAADQRAEFSTA